ncbi:MAG: glycosyltransferase [Dehalococcoidia bacterium]|nr:glycosyltransferase [Dehalococcoidia bacterium]
MRVLQAVHQFLPRYVGGTELYTAQLCHWLQAQGHDVAVLAGGDTGGDVTWEGIPVTTTPGGLHGPKGPGALFLSSFGNRQAEVAFQRLLAEFRPDVVHIHHLMGLSPRLPALAKAAGVPVCATLHDYWFLCPKSQLIDHRDTLCGGPQGGVNCARCAVDRLGRPHLMPLAPLAAPLFASRQARVRRAFAACDLLMTPSRFVADVAREAGLPPDRMLPVDFGIDASAPLPRVERAPGDPLRVAYLGSIDESKGVHVLLEACRILDPRAADVAVYGNLATANGGYQLRMRRLAARTPYGEALLQGPLPHSQVPAMLAATDVLVVPSTWYENAPLVISEAFAAGVVVVASNQGALAEKVRDGVDGLLFPRGDAPALATVLRRMAGDRGLVDRLRLGTPRHASRGEHWAQVEAVYQRLVEARQR